MASTEPENLSPVVEPAASAEPSVEDYLNPPVDPDPDPEPEPAPEDPPLATAPDPDPDLEPGDEEYNEKIQKRIGKAVGKQREAERRADLAEAALEEQRQAAPPPPKAPDPPSVNVAPNVDDFENYEDYIRAVASHAADQKWYANEQARAAAAARAKVTTKMDDGRKKLEDQHGVKDFDIVFKPYAKGGPVVTPPMFEFCNESEHTAALAYYLAKHPDIADGIAGKSPMGVARDLSRIEADIESGTIKFGIPSTTNAPPPTPPRVGGKQPAGADVDPDKLPIKEWMKREQEGTLRYK